jgi:peptide-methionine (R)-S-oxide reductase
MKRREFIRFSLSGILLAAFAPYFKAGKALASARIDKLILSDAEWKKKLTAQQYAILREEDTERPFTSDLLNEKRSGIFSCVACNLPLFYSTYKYDSGTGWPSFFDCIPHSIETRTDYKLLYPRTEYHCARCGGHHGHVFEDGPKPTGLRYCNNGAVLTFTPSEG